MEDDLNTALALSVVWEMMKSGISDEAKKNLINVMDSVLGLNLGTEDEKDSDIPEEIKDLLSKREEARKTKNWAESDAIRDQINAAGYKILDGADGAKVEKI
jgi:cysteinyl-tRNA synthetase